MPAALRSQRTVLATVLWLAAGAKPTGMCSVCHQVLLTSQNLRVQASLGLGFYIATEPVWHRHLCFQVKRLISVT